MSKWFSLYTPGTMYGYRNVSMRIWLYDVVKTKDNPNLGLDYLDFEWQGNMDRPKVDASTYYGGHISTHFGLSRSGMSNMKEAQALISKLAKTGYDLENLSGALLALESTGYHACQIHRPASLWFPVDTFPSGDWWDADNHQIRIGCFAETAEKARETAVKSFAKVIAADGWHGEYASRGLDEWTTAGKPVNRKGQDAMEPDVLALLASIRTTEERSA